MGIFYWFLIANTQGGLLLGPEPRSRPTGLFVSLAVTSTDDGAPLRELFGCPQPPLSSDSVEFLATVSGARLVPQSTASLAT